MKPDLMLDASLCFLGPKQVGWISILEYMCVVWEGSAVSPHLCQSSHLHKLIFSRRWGWLPGRSWLHLVGKLGPGLISRTSE